MLQNKAQTFRVSFYTVTNSVILIVSYIIIEHQSRYFKAQNLE